MADLVKVIRQLENQKSEIEGQLSRVNAAVAALNGLSGKNGSGKSAIGGSARIMSAAARGRIAAAQKVRWAKWRKQHKKAA